jgi:hypothetical protein
MATKSLVTEEDRKRARETSLLKYQMDLATDVHYIMKQYCIRVAKFALEYCLDIDTVEEITHLPLSQLEKLRDEIEGAEEGKVETPCETAIRLIKFGYAPEMISKRLNLTLAEVIDLYKKL